MYAIRSYYDKGSLLNAEGTQEAISQITLFDMAFPENVDARLKCVKGDLNDIACVESALGGDTSAVFHLASVVSGGAEADFELGYKVNLDGTRGLLDASRKQAKPPRFVFTSSVAVFGGELPDVLDDGTTPNPQGSYGAQKVICEYLVTDYSRKGYIDGRSVITSYSIHYTKLYDARVIGDEVFADHLLGTVGALLV